jgi:hypothetical protein
MGRGIVVRFVVSAVIGALVAVGMGALTARPQITSTARSDEPIALTGTSGAPLEFSLVPGDPKPIEALPATATIQLTSFHAPTTPAASTPPGGGIKEPWWRSSVPRVPAVTQFDGGPLQGVNCTMASGAMLARLAFGVVTTGSQLRALQDDQEGGTNFGNLQNAVGRGWGIRFASGALTPLQLRAVLFAGAGAVVDGFYGELPTSLRLQPNFTGGHAIYVDAFRPPDANGPAAYYVMDPIGRTWQGYKGAWWPADALERFATTFGGGRIYTAWAFPGGVVPANHPVLPPSAYPTATGRPGESPRASEPPADPMPSGDIPPTADPPVGEPPGEVPHFPDFHFKSDISEVKEPGVVYCLAQPPPAGCPRGIRGFVDLRGLTTATATAPPAHDIRVLYASTTAPGVYQLLIEAPPGTSSDLWYWTKAGQLQAAEVEAAMLDGKSVAVATVTVDPTVDFSFVATASGDGIRAVGSVGSLAVGT